MLRSEAIDKLSEALAKAQGQMQAAKKDSANPFFKSKYADLASIIEVMREPFSKNGLSYVQFPRYDGKQVTVLTQINHASGQWVSEELSMTPMKPDPQGIGSTITYARRYGLQSMAGVPSEDDDGNAASGNGHVGKHYEPPKEIKKPVEAVVPNYEPIIAEEWEKGILAAGDLDQLASVWKNMPMAYRTVLSQLKDKRKAELTSPEPVGVE